MDVKGTGWVLISIGGGAYNHPNHREWMIDSASRLSDGTQPDDPGAPGSTAFLAGYSNVWQLDAAGVWTQCVSSGGSGGGGTTDGAAAAALAPPYSANATYEAGELVTRNGRIYKAAVDIDEPEAYDSAKWEEQSVAKLLDDTATEVLTKVENAVVIVDDNLVYGKLTDNE